MKPSPESTPETSAAQQPEFQTPSKRDPRGVGNGPVTGRFVLLAVPVGGEAGYVTSWDTWEECEVAFEGEQPTMPRGFVLRDDETGREWLPGSTYEWEAART